MYLSELKSEDTAFIKGDLIYFVDFFELNFTRLKTNSKQGKKQLQLQLLLCSHFSLALPNVYMELINYIKRYIKKKKRSCASVDEEEERERERWCLAGHEFLTNKLSFGKQQVTM